LEEELLHIRLAKCKVAGGTLALARRYARIDAFFAEG
jgi:hypothetical protein